MNRVLPLLVLCFVSGCGSDERDTKIAKLEARLSEIETNYQSLDNRFTNLLGTVELAVRGMGSFSAELGKVTEETKALMTKWESDRTALVEVLMKLEAASTNQPLRQPVRYSTTKTAQRANTAETKDGIPLSVYNEIKADAVKRWPGEYNMQVYEIKTQVEAYRKLYP